MYPFIANLLVNKKYRLRLIMGVIIIILIPIFVYRILFSDSEKVPDGAIITVICKSCGKKENMRVVNIGGPKYVCPECGAKLGQLYKCYECQYEFSVIIEPVSPEQKRGKNKWEILELVRFQTRCPNCSSLKTRAIIKNNTD